VHISVHVGDVHSSHRFVMHLFSSSFPS
jgi:hypothetical protein